MRDLVYYVATSLDGFVAGPRGEVDDFALDPQLLAELFERYPETCPAHLREPLGVTGEARRFDTVVMGARTHQPALDAGLTSAYPHLDQHVVTHRELPDDPSVTRVEGDVVAHVAALRSAPGRDIWLCGGGDLAGQLVDLVDELQLKVNPVLLGEGVPLARLGYAGRAWRLADVERLPGDVVLLTYRRRDEDVG
ncbi:dihydrofolate reductase family protein [Janibacter sp. UYMM211]|uniref:dihydrofolate reductase family protein n=1 Tax=Janibacter sp. UYMM211 TaxID=3156342 RepID=UPI0033921F94